LGNWVLGNAKIEEGFFILRFKETY